MPSDRQQASSGLSATTLMIASASSVAAALVVSRIWGPGTLIGAATTPVIVTLVSEALRRPATVISTVRETRSGRFDPVAEGRAGLREGDLEQARSPIPAAAVAERRVHRASGGVAGGRGGSRLRLPRPRVIAAVATGLVAFVVAGVFLTGSELVLGKSVVSSSKRTTYIPVHRSTPSSTTKDKTDTTKSDTTTTTTPTTTTAPTQTQPPPAATTPTAPPAQAAPPPATTAPPAGTPPATTAPAPQSAPPPPATTP